MILDLHTHSTASDGQYTPAELIDMAKKRELVIFAITDHDTINGLKEAKQRAKELDVNFVPGIEISSDDGEEIHIVGLCIDENNPVLAAECEAFIASRDNRQDRQDHKDQQTSASHAQARCKRRRSNYKRLR